VDISCAFATSLDTPEQIAIAERLGYARAWCFDSPPLYPDVWMTLALAAQRTTAIGLGPGVLVPNLRHVMTNAAAIATLEALAPGRVAVAVGAGFTGRLALGQRPMSWKTIRAYIIALKALLRGEEVDWDGTLIKMLHRDGFAPRRPIDVPVLVAASGPKGFAVAAEVGDGVVLASPSEPLEQAGFSRVIGMYNGTVLDDREAPDSQRALAATGHGAALIYHVAYEGGWVASLPRGAEFAARVDALAPNRRHLSTHEGHLVGLNDLDRDFVTAEFIASHGNALPAAAWQERLTKLAREGMTEVVYQPAGPDIPRELSAFAAMAGVTPRS
jgi:5,10-methylenetetrahydromethanopterin reductase